MTATLMAKSPSKKRNLVFTCHLDKLMAERLLNQTELHRHSGVAVGTIRSLIKGAVIERIDRSSTEKLMKFFDCDFDDLYSVEWK
jgi:DNA-binding Xre family transcriptional regulator